MLYVSYGRMVFCRISYLSACRGGQCPLNLGAEMLTKAFHPGNLAKVFLNKAIVSLHCDSDDVLGKGVD
jgi:hypothetical protein